MSKTTTKAISGFARAISEIDILSRARYPFLVVPTKEEPRFWRGIMAWADTDRHRAKGLFRWSRASGLHQALGPGAGPTGRNLPNLEAPQAIIDHITQAERGIFVLCDFHPYLDPMIMGADLLVRSLRELAWTIKTRPITVVFVGPTFPKIPELEKEIRRVEFPLPDEEEIDELLTLQFEQLAHNPSFPIQLKEDDRGALVQALTGLTEVEIENVIAQMAIRFKGLSAEAIPYISDERRYAVEGNPALKYIPARPMDQFGGYPEIRRRIVNASYTFRPEAKQYGVEPAKGLFLVGFPGCGKDYLMEVASGIIGKPLLYWEIGRSMGSHVGESEQQAGDTLDQAYASRCLLGISEGDKLFSGMESSGSTDGGTTARVNGQILAWLNKQDRCYVMVSANDIRRLKPEQVRQGRFDEVVFVGLPNAADRQEIVSVHLRRRGRSPEEFDLAELVAVTENFSGAEIEAAVKGAILDAYIENVHTNDSTEVATGHIVRRARSIRPIYEVKHDELVEIEQWAKASLAVDAGTGAALGEGVGSGAGRALEA